MLGVCRVAGPIRFRPMLAYLARGCLVLLLFPVGLAGQEGQVTLYTPDGSQQRTLSTPMIVDVGLPSPMEAPASAVVGTGTGTGTRITEVEVVVSKGSGGQVTTSYADGWILSLAADASGNVWVGTSAGLSRFDGHQWTTFTQADGLADDHISSLAVDGQGQVWAGSRYGKELTRFDGQRWTRYRFEGPWGNVIAIAPNGDVWCASYGDFLLARFDGQDWWTYDHDDMGIVEGDPWWDYIGNGIVDSAESFSSVEVIEIAFDRSGMLWATLKFWNPSEWSWVRPLSFNGAQWTSYQFDAWMIFPDSEGRVWMSCINGLCVKDGSTWKRYDEVGTGDYRRWRVGEMTEDEAGRLWIAEGSYFGVLEVTTWTGFPYEEFRADIFVPPVTDSRGDLWIPSWDALYRWHHSDLPTAIESSSISAEPRSFHLAQNYPNPFNHATHIGFTLQQPAVVALKVFNTHGQLVATLVEGTRPAGTYQTVWDGRNDQGQAVSSGTYIVWLDAAGQQATRKMLLIQ